MVRLCWWRVSACVCVCAYAPVNCTTIGERALTMVKVVARQGLRSSQPASQVTNQRSPSSFLSFHQIFSELYREAARDYLRGRAARVSRYDDFYRAKCFGSPVTQSPPANSVHNFCYVFKKKAGNERAAGRLGQFQSRYFRDGSFIGQGASCSATLSLPAANICR